MSTKKVLSQELGVSVNTLKKLIEAVGVETTKENYSNEEVEKIRLGRSLMTEEKKTYDDLREHFNVKKAIAAGFEREKKREADPIKTVREVIQNSVDLEIQRVTDEAMIDALERLPEFFQESINRAITNGTIDRLQTNFRGGNKLTGGEVDQFVDVESEEIS